MLEQERPAVVTLQCQSSFAMIKGPYKISLCHWSYATVTPSYIFYPLLFRKCLETRHFFSSDGEATNNCFISLLIARYIIRVLEEHVARILLASRTKGKFYKNNASFIARNVDEKKARQGNKISLFKLWYWFTLFSFQSLHCILVYT